MNKKQHGRAIREGTPLAEQGRHMDWYQSLGAIADIQAKQADKTTVGILQLAEQKRKEDAYRIKQDAFSERHKPKGPLPGPGAEPRPDKPAVMKPISTGA